jgi:hypothetical protein
MKTAYSDGVLRIFLGDTHPYYHGLMMALAVYIAWRVTKPVKSAG